MKKLLCWVILGWMVTFVLYTITLDEPVQMGVNLLFSAFMIELAVTDLAGSNKLV